MPVLNFQKQFAEAVEKGEKMRTIRATRKRPFRKGDRLYLYTGMRTKYCRKLGEAIAEKVFPIEITKSKLVWIGEFPPIDEYEMNELANKDGFKDFDEMYNWFENTHGLPFVGQLIIWESISN